MLTAGTNGTLLDQVVIDTLCLDFSCPPDLIVSADSGQCSKANVTWTLPAVNGCTVTNVTSTPPSGSTLPVGTNLVTSMIYDGQGGSKTCNFSVIVRDNEAPVVACPANITVPKDPSQCGAVVTFAATATDNCSGATAACVPSSGSLFPLGLSTVTCTATDAVGNVSAPCTFNVRVVDLTGDLLAYQPCWRGQSGSTFQQWAFSVSNNPAAIPPELATNSYGPPLASLVEGPFSAGYIESDGFLGCRQGIWDLGHLGTMTLNIPNDPASPAGSYKYVQVQVTQYRDGLYDENAAVAIAGGTLVSEQQHTNETTFFGGNWVVAQSIWRLGPPCPASEAVVLTAGTNGTLLDQVVIDTLCLYLPCPIDIAASADPGHCSKSNVTWSLPAVNGCTVTNVTSTPPAGSTFVVGTTPVHVVITDGEGGTKTCDFNVVITDDEAPVALCKNITVNLNALGLATITGADVDNGSTDNCGISNRTVFPDTFTCADKGPNSVTLTVTDVHGHTATCNATVTVQDLLPPVIACPGDITTTNDLGQCSAVVSYVAPVGTDNCPGASTVQTAGLPSGSAFPVGKTTNTFQVTDAALNTASCSFVVTVTDAQPPMIACPGDITTTSDLGQCSAVVSYVAPVGTDNCPGASTVQTAGLPSGSAFPVGKTTNTFQVTDAALNTASCSFVVTVTDAQPPMIACPGDITTTSDLGQCSAVVSYVAPVGTDNCPGASTVQTAGLPSGSAFPVGKTTNTFQVTDAALNTASCSFVVTVTAQADLSVAITSSANPAPLGTNLTYTITVSNGGPCTATGIVLSNYLSAGQVEVAVTNGPTGNACPFPGPEAWWRAEGNVNDAADGHHGALAGGVAYVPGEVGQAFSFDGLTGSVSVPDAPGLRPAAVTIEGWIKVQDVTGVHVIIGKRVGAGTSDSYSIWVGSGVLFATMADNAGSGPFLTYPEFPSSSLFTAGDIVDMQSFALALKAQADPVSQFIYANLSASTVALLTAYSSGPDPALLAALLGDLNIIIQSGSIYTPARFAAVTLSPESNYILGRSPSGSDLVRLNRFLIRDAYPADFATVVFPQLTDWFHVAYSFDPVTQVQALYVNGALVNASLVTKTIAYDTHPVLLGADDNGGSPGFFYQGNIDELSIYSRALTGTEIRAIYNANGAGKCLTPPGLSSSLGSLANGATAQVTVTARPISCPAVSAAATVTSTSIDPNLANNVATLSVPVLDLPPDGLRLTIEKVSANNNLLRICWPLTCNPFVFQATPNLNFPITFSTEAAPFQMVDDLNCTIVPATNDMRYFRVYVP